MARRKTLKPDEQLDLMELGPENAKAIKRAARAYKDAQTQKASWAEDENAQKNKILALVREAGLHANDKGVIQFQLDGIIITITPRDELVRVATKKEKEAAESDEE